MEPALDPVLRRVDIGSIELAVRQWPAGERRPYLLVHGLASNSSTWDGVARALNREGHPVVAVDQRGHGLSDKPDDGYGFRQTTQDLRDLIEALGFERPVIAGQSWGGNVALEFAARWPELLSGLVMVDGGFIDLSAREDATWDEISVQLRPPNLLGTPRALMLERMRDRRSDWPPESVEMALASFETLDDGTVRPWLSLDNHMKILRSLWEQKPSALYARIETPTLIAVAPEENRGPRSRKEDEVAKARDGIANVHVKWFVDTAHDIHMQRPDDLAAWLLEYERAGFFDGGTG